MSAIAASGYSGLADKLFGRVYMPAHHEAHGKAPFGYSADTRGPEATDPTLIATAKGPQALLGPSSPLFWLGGLVLAFMFVNASARS